MLNGNGGVSDKIIIDTDPGIGIQLFIPFLYYFIIFYKSDFISNFEKKSMKFHEFSDVIALWFYLLCVDDEIIQMD